MAEWRVIFLVTVVLYIIEIIAFMSLGSGEEQPWNKGSKSEYAEVEGTEGTPLNRKDGKNTYQE